ncbi:DUF6479 family protein [Streptomyces sp. HD]|uniref:DUF6479 family protein n=1 Tax=Streptomyces sp. HD TaxID=3020892 RepID=UPI00232C63AB|nr:DUF6479 family protein [Streptomyces sp. HD]MDC0769048.1 DUF6479 family protein [Streptomyces sp. HD]
MDTAWMDIAAARGALAIGLFVAGVAVVALLVGAFVLGIRIRRREPRPPRPEEQPSPPAGGPVREVREHREPAEMPKSDHRVTPHELPAHGNIPSRPSPSKHRRRWGDGDSGAFGSGGPGGT